MFVRAAISGVIREAIIAACLTAIMILLFLGSWRSTLIIAISIPLSILCSICVLSALGETINIMTLGGLALAVGILVDDATVTIENIDRNFDQGKDLHTGILDGAAQIAVPALVSTLCICIVFIPMFFLTGVARYLFVPLAEAVVFAMLASYVLSRTLVPTLAMYLLKVHGHHSSQPQSWNIAARFQRAFERGFEAARMGYLRTLEELHPPPPDVRSRLPRALRRRISADPLARPRFLPSYRRRAVQPALPRQNRHSHRRNRAAGRLDRNLDARNNSTSPNLPASSTISGFRIVPSIRRIATPRPSAPWMPTFWLR